MACCTQQASFVKQTVEGQALILLHGRYRAGSPTAGHTLFDLSQAWEIAIRSAQSQYRGPKQRTALPLFSGVLAVDACLRCRGAALAAVLLGGAGRTCKAQSKTVGRGPLVVEAGSQTLLYSFSTLINCMTAYHTTKADSEQFGDMPRLDLKIGSPIPEQDLLEVT